MCIYIYIYIYSKKSVASERKAGYSAEGGAVGGGVQWIGVVLYGKIVFNIIRFTTPCFHCTPLCRM